MASTSHERERSSLERTLRQSDYQDLLHRFRADYRAYKAFESWKDACDCARECSLGSSDADPILRPILETRLDCPTTQLTTVLLALFWPWLVSLLSWQRRWDSDSDTLWANLLGAFAEATHGLDPDKREKRLAQKIVNDTRHRLYEMYEREWSRRKEEPLLDDLLSKKKIVEEDLISDTNCFIDNEAIQICQLERYWKSGLLDETDFYILRATLVYI